MTVSSALLAVGLGSLAGLLLTLMDRIDEHRIIERHRTMWAYLAGIGTAATMAGAIKLYPTLYPLLIGLCVEWILKNKIDFPSHVFFLFLLTLYLGWRIELLAVYAPSIALYLAVRWFSGSWFKSRMADHSTFWRWYYTSYFEKFVCSLVLAMSLTNYILVAFSAGFAVASRYVKRGLSERTGGHSNTTCE